jgi:uncharacterized protein YgiB involved in biofilm formation
MAGAHWKSSRHVTLVLIGLAGLAGCGEERRDIYASRENCLADWGNKPEDCSPATEAHHASRGYFYGPSYLHGSFGSPWGWGARSASSNHAMMASRSIGASGSSSRGGFGASGHSSSS